MLGFSPIFNQFLSQQTWRTNRQADFQNIVVPRAGVLGIHPKAWYRFIRRDPGPFEEQPTPRGPTKWSPTTKQPWRRPIVSRNSQQGKIPWRRETPRCVRLLNTTPIVNWTDKSSRKKTTTTQLNYVKGIFSRNYNRIKKLEKQLVEREVKTPDLSLL